MDLPQEWQRQLAPYLARVPSRGVVLDAGGLLTWMVSGTPDQAAERLEGGLQGLSAIQVLDAQGAAGLASAALSLADQLPDRDRKDARGAVAERVGAWLSEQRDDDDLSQLIAGAGVCDLICERFWISEMPQLPPHVVRRLLSLAVTAAAEPEEALAQLVSAQHAPNSGFDSALSLLQSEQLDLDRVIEHSTASGDPCC